MRAQDPGHLLGFLDSWELHLRAQNRSARTLQSYRETCEQFAAFLEAEGRPTALGEIRREDVASWIASLVARFRPSTAAVRFRSLQVFWRWAVHEDEVERSPMTGMQAPNVPDQRTPVLDSDQLRALLQACAGKGFEERRDAALLMVFL